MPRPGLLPFDLSYDLKNPDQLPPHITYEDYVRIHRAVEEHHRSFPGTERRAYLAARDRLFVRFLWKTGGRVEDICDLRESDLDLVAKVLRLRIKKARPRKVITVTLSDLIVREAREFLAVHGTTLRRKEKGRLFGFSQQAARKNLVKYARATGLHGIHPHLFRHGLALHLLDNRVPIPVISARLGHSRVQTTVQMYLKITPEIQRRFLDEVQLHPSEETGQARGGEPSRSKSLALLTGGG